MFARVWRGGESWGKVDPDRLPDAVVCYSDATIALPLLTAYALAKHEPRKPKRLYARREELMDRLRDEYEAARAEAGEEEVRPKGGPETTLARDR